MSGDLLKWTMRCGRPYYENCTCASCGGTKVQANKRRARHKLKRECREIEKVYAAKQSTTPADAGRGEG